MWSNYRSAVTSAAQRRNWKSGNTITYADVPDHLWKPVDKAAEAKRSRLQNLAADVTWDDPKTVVDMLTTLMGEARQRLSASRPGLSDREREEVDLLLGRLVDAS